MSDVGHVPPMDEHNRELVRRGHPPIDAAPFGDGVMELCTPTKRHLDYLFAWRR